METKTKYFSNLIKYSWLNLRIIYYQYSFLNLYSDMLCLFLFKMATK